MKNFWLSLPAKLRDASDGLGLLALRIWLAQEFLHAGLMKLKHGSMAPEWFVNLNFPFPVRLLSEDQNWVAAGLGETVFGALLLIGLQTRLASLSLLFITWVAVYTVHFDLGFAGWDQIDTEMGQGFKLPLMMACMLLATLTQGGGRWSADAVVCRLFRRFRLQAV